jgi:hypothetical protein
MIVFSAFLSSHRGTFNQGDSVPSLPITTLEGCAASLRTEAGMAVFVFSTDCPACFQSLSALSRMAADSAWCGTLVGVSLSSRDATRRMVSALGTAFPVVCADASLLSALWHITFVPTLLLVREHGFLEHLWTGAHTPQSVRSILKRFFPSPGIVPAGSEPFRRLSTTIE